jgi:uncharacterized protein YlxW (UPF0749 family)
LIKPSFSLRSIGPALVVGLLAFMITVDLYAQHTTEEATAGRRAQLAGVITERQRYTADLEKRLAALRAQADELASRDGSSQLNELQAAAAQIAGTSGTVAVSGPGVVVTLTDAKDAQPGSADDRIQDVDVQAVVNELWAAGAEAVAVNGQRVVASTAIRNAGGAVLVNFRVLTSPYRIQAVGNRDRLRSALDASDIARRFADWRDIYGLGFSIADEGRLQIPAFEGTVRYRYAKPAKG